jgi:transposase
MNQRVGPNAKHHHMIDTTQKNTTDRTLSKDALTIYAGVDVSKNKLDVHCHEWGEPRIFANTPAGLAQMHSQLPDGTHIVCEASGGYEQLLLEDAWAKGCAVSRVNPARVRYYAKAMGLLAKTDAIDAELITLFAGAKAPAPADAPTRVQRELCAAVRRRTRVAFEIAAQKTALDREADTWVKRDIKATLTFLQRRRDKLEEHIDKLIASSAELAGKRKLMMGVKGVGKVSSAIVLGECRELGQITDAQAASLAGLAPFNKDSGTKKGTRSIMGGRGALRRALYMPAMSASRHNPILREFYTRLIEKGKPHHVAITAVMRKLICLLNRLLADPEFELS